MGDERFELDAIETIEHARGDDERRPLAAPSERDGVWLEGWHNDDSRSGEPERGAETLDDVQKAGVIGRLPATADRGEDPGL